MTTGGGGMPILLPYDAERPATGLVLRFRGQVGVRYGKIPPPDSDWRPAPDRRTVRFHQEPTVYPCEEQAVYFYFRTHLTLPVSVNRPSDVLNSSRIDEVLLVLVNGKPLPQKSGNEIPIGELLHSGDNVLTVILGDWCIAADLQGVSFTGKTVSGAPVTAILAASP